ncbi:FAD dependent oxidoreductase [Dactylonectria estremocensis]|uniref:FAD dependent oxidoreductase n=1 Tax=Dactylonectria estremocensis TaxID=1079267 RepID=A0A9P9ETV4_9HYPO|nr:FAD dependent oxidoreductase [Dactylonectria estremocensis]
MSHAAFPPPNGMGSFWRSQTGDLDSHRSTSELPAQCDIVIIGAGYSGAALVTHILSKRGDKAPSILVLEARQLCSGATGRNGGHLKPDSYYSIARLANEYGIDAAAEVADFEAANFEAVADFIRDEKVNCDFVITRAIDVQLSAEHQDRIQAGYRSLLAQGVKATKNTYCAPPEFAERLSGVKGAKGCFSYTAGHLWPYKLAHHMFREAVAKGVNLQANTPVQTISSTRDANGFWMITTNRGVVKTRQVIMATNAYTAAILPEYAGKIIPYRAICSRITVPGRAPLLTNSYALRFNDWDFDYLIPRPDGSIIVGGARQAYIRHLEDWYGNSNDGELIERARGYFDGYMQRHFNGWENSGAVVDQVWTGIMGYSSDRLPRVGPIPDRSGMFIMGGFTGHGMPQVFLCASGLADMVLGTAEFGESGIPRLFEESRERLSDDRNRVLEIYQEPLSELTSKL